MDDIAKEIEEYVKNECQKPDSKYGYAPFKYHFVPMVKYADELADELGGDKEIILIAAWLHDIGSIVYGRKNHHKTGTKIAKQKLTELNYSGKKIELVKQCILNHRGSRNDKRKTIEEKIIAEADILSNFEDIAGLFEVAFVYENKNRSEAKNSVLNKLQRKWNQLEFNKSKNIIKPKFEAATLLFK
jgi:uncharacterized protein